MSLIPSLLGTVTYSRLSVGRRVGQLGDESGRAFISVYGPAGRTEEAGSQNTMMPISIG